jgi:molybdopterin molybdotransferase
MLTVDQALRRVLAAVRPLPSRSVPVPRAAGLVSAAPLRARVDLPGFDNSQVDGFAVRAADLRRVPAVLPVREEIWAGGWPKRRVGPGTASRIATGAPMPPGADAVLMLEDADYDGRRVTAKARVRSGENVRYRGEDVKRGAVVLPAGKVCSVPDLMLAAQTGHGTLRVLPRPRVALLSTGDELLEPGRKPARGKIFDGNSVGLEALAVRAGAEVTGRDRAPDRPAALKASCRRLLRDADVLVACAGVSVGERDYVRRVLKSLGYRENLWRISMKPGRPLALLTGKRKTIFCLPGNPVSAFVTFLLFVEPALAKLSGRHPPLFTGTARVAERTSRSSRRQFLRGFLKDGVVRSTGGQGSHMLGSLVKANCLYEVPEGRGSLARGTKVRVILLQ